MASYFQSLQPVSVSDSPGTRTAIYALRPDGRILTFVLYQGVYVPDADVPDSVIAISGGYQYHAADDTIETYNAAGQLQTVTPRGGSPLTVHYLSGDHFPSSVNDAFGHTLMFSYAVVDGVYKLVSFTDPSGAVVSFGYNGNFMLASVTYPDGKTRSYSYGASGDARSLTQLTDEANVAYASWSYSPDGSQVLSSSHAGGVEAYSFEYPYGADYRKVTDPLGTVRTYQQSLIQGSYRFTGVDSICAGCDEESSRTYDFNGNVASRTDFNGVQTIYGYDLDRNLETTRT